MAGLVIRAHPQGAAPGNDSGEQERSGCAKCSSFRVDFHSMSTGTTS